MRPMLALVGLALALGLSATASATILNVPADYPTIQSGIDASADGDTVMVGYGVYTGAGNTNIDFEGKAIAVVSHCGPGATIIDCEQNTCTGCRGVHFHSGEGPSSVLQGFTIRNGHTFGAWPQSSGGGILCDGSSPTIIGCVVICNVSDGAGGGIACRNSSATLIGTTIVANMTPWDGGGIYSDGSSLLMDRTTVVGNEADKGGGIFCSALSSVEIINSIVWDNEAAVAPQIQKTGGSTVTVTHSDVQGGWTGEGNIDVDPEFVLPEKRDLRLLWESACIDTGHPDSLDPDGTRRDMGAHFFDQDDHLTIYLTPDATAVPQGGQSGVTYTVINRWAQPETFWVLTHAVPPAGAPLVVMGPSSHTIPAEYTMLAHLEHDLPLFAPLGDYIYYVRIGMPPAVEFDTDRFLFTVTELESVDPGRRVRFKHGRMTF